MHLQDIRKEYTKETLEKELLEDQPIKQFNKWLQQALQSEVPEPTAMTIATNGKDGFPSSRVVLLKGIEDERLVFFTNYESQKGKELALIPKVSALFFWPELQRQIRVVGTVEKTSANYSNDYFYSRPIDSQIGAIASPQSSVIDSRDVIEEKVVELKSNKSANVTRPEHWGGYFIVPNYFEFWQGRPSRLHDRFAYTKVSENDWKIERLAP